MREAHAVGSPRPAKHVAIEQPTSIEERRKVAVACSEALKLTVPVLVDDIEDSVAKAFHAMPDRLFILDGEGKIAYRGDRGPRGFRPDEMEHSLRSLLGR